MSLTATILKEQFFNSLGLPWSDILPDSRLNEIVEEESMSYRSRLYTPIVTLWAMLTAKTPEMVRKEIWAHLLGYNLLRSLMELAAPLAEHARPQLSVQGARQHFNQMLALLAHATRATRARLYNHLLENIATDLVPVRSNRHEPRVVKRRPKSFPRMKQPRALLKAKLAD